MSKTYKLYGSPSDRLREALDPFRRSFHSDFYAVHDVSFEVSRGETFGIVGKNGSGKSTLLQMICGILQPSGGRVAVSGRISALLELGAGFNPEFTGIENVYLNCSILGLSRAEVDAKLDSILSFADIGDFVHQPVKTYSSGMYVRLAFSVMANIDPEIFVVDEALAVGDAYFVHRCMNRFRELQERGTTILFVTHDISSIKRFCSRALWLHEGRVKALGNAVQVSDAYLEHLFGVSTETCAHDVTSSEEPALSESTEEFSTTPEQYLPETIIPNVDKRYGSGAMRICGVNIYDEMMRPVTEVDHGKTITLRVTYESVRSIPSTCWNAGYIVRDFKGLDIASFDAASEGVELAALDVGSKCTLSFAVDLPILYPGNYSFSPTVGYDDPSSGEHIICDRITNAIVLEIRATSVMHVMMKFPTRVEPQQHG